MSVLVICLGTEAESTGMCKYVWIQHTKFSQILQFHKIQTKIQDLIQKIRNQWVPGALSPGVNRPGRYADHSPPTPPYAFIA
jgi:hypothetical protein